MPKKCFASSQLGLTEDGYAEKDRRDDREGMAPHDDDDDDERICFNVA